MMLAIPRASVPQDGPRCPPSDGTARQPATSSLPTLAEWLGRFCRLFDCGNCYCDGREIPCRVLASRPERCHEAEHGALLGAPDAVLGQYRRVLFLSRPKAPDRPVDVTPDAPELAPRGRLCQCGAALPRRRRMCDGCRLQARRATKRECERARRERMYHLGAQETHPRRTPAASGATT